LPPFLRLSCTPIQSLQKSRPGQRGKGIIDIMPTSKDVRPLTNEQAVQLRHDLTLVEERLQDIAILMRVSYGEDSQAVIRADETAAALQRLKWELERMQVRRQAAGSF
jgi:Trm5-related predicted tRNA methylase